MRVLSTFLGVALSVAMTVPSDAAACGGCFAPQGNPSFVDSHKMVLAISPRGTTLWDQIQYTGAPEDFVWVLPIAGTAAVEVAENAFFESLTATTQIVMRAPQPPPTGCFDPCTALNFFSGARSSAGGDAAASVAVFHEGVVGPYETATIGSEDPDALVAWLRERHYQVDDSLIPIIDFYVQQHMNFAVLRLQPTAGIDRMQPVRVTTPGLGTSLPLRMVAAGVQNAVDLELFVFAESRIEASNFGNAEVDRAAIAYDWATRSFDYEVHFDDALFAGTAAGTNWVTEYANVPLFEQIASYYSRAPDGTVTSAVDDAAIVQRALDVPYLTRLRTRLPVSELDRDLYLQAGGDGIVDTLIDVTRERNRAPDPVCPTVCVTGGSLEPGGSATPTGDRCSVTAVGAGAGGGLAWLVLLGAWAARRRR